MPELPDLEVYAQCITRDLRGQPLLSLSLRSPFVLRTVVPRPSAFAGRVLKRVELLGKRLAFAFEGDHWAVIHLMRAGRLRWRDGDAKPPGGKMLQASLRFNHGSLHLTEAGSKRRASLHLFDNALDARVLDPGGLDVFAADGAEFLDALHARNRTLKRALSDPRTFGGIGNAYSDEILFEAQLSPARLTQRIDAATATRLLQASRAVLLHWEETLGAEVGDGFPEKVTAFREGMAVHGRFGQPCPRCGAPVQRIRYADRETNYCAACQTGGRRLADRAMSRLLGKDWPRELAASDDEGL